MPSPQEILDRLRRVPYPGFTRDIVSFGLVKDIEVSSTAVTVHLTLTTTQEDTIREIERAVRAAIAAMPGIPGQIEVVETRAAQPARPRGPQPIPGVDTILAVASGKGGVGK